MIRFRWIAGRAEIDPEIRLNQFRDPFTGQVSIPFGVQSILECRISYDKRQAQEVSIPYRVQSILELSDFFDHVLISRLFQSLTGFNRFWNPGETLTSKQYHAVFQSLTGFNRFWNIDNYFGGCPR